MKKAEKEYEKLVRLCKIYDLELCTDDKNIYILGNISNSIELIKLFPSGDVENSNWDIDHSTLHHNSYLLYKHIEYKRYIFSLYKKVDESWRHNIPKYVFNDIVELIKINYEKRRDKKKKEEIIKELDKLILQGVKEVELPYDKFMILKNEIDSELVTSSIIYASNLEHSSDEFCLKIIIHLEGTI